MTLAQLWYQLPAPEALQQLGSSSEKGLTADEPAARLHHYGPAIRRNLRVLSADQVSIR